jgi:hypothetical protein
LPSPFLGTLTAERCETPPQEFRTTADRTVFDTCAEPAAIVGGALNLWSGFAIKPTRGNCERFKPMILNDLCSGDAKVFDIGIGAA